MAQKSNATLPHDPLNWGDVVSHYVSRNQRKQALDFLNEVMSGEDMPLFRSSGEIDEQKRLAWLCRIELLWNWGEKMEALAWVCLECDLKPDNIEAAALKQKLKRKLGLVRSPARRNGRGSGCETRFSWEGVAGMRELKAMLERDVILPLEEPEIYEKYRVGVPNGVLLYGPPGCGKTFIARQLATMLGFHFIEVKPSDLASIYVHGTQGKIGELFADARSKAPCMIFFDELDALMPRRDQAHHSYANEVNEFLVQLNVCSKMGIFVIGATNQIDRIDPAARRPGRLDKKVFVGPPDFEARLELLRLQMDRRPQDELDWDLLADKTENFSGAEIEHLVNEAARAALGRREPIRMSDFMDAIGQNPPSLSKQSILAEKGKD